MPVKDRSKTQPPVEVVETMKTDLVKTNKKKETPAEKFRWDMREHISETARTFDIQDRYRENLDRRLWSHQRYLSDFVDPLDIAVLCEAIELLKRINGDDVMEGYLQPGEFLATLQVVVAGKHIPESVSAAPGVQ